MGLLDGLLGQVLGGAMGTPQDVDPAGSMRSRGMPGGTGGMGGLDAMLGGGAGGGAGQGALMAILLQLLQSHGGLGGLLSRFQQAGYQQQADSWVSPGENVPIDGDALSKVLGEGPLGRIAEQLGLPRGEAADRVASALPDVVDRMTPRGSVPADSDDVVSRALEILQRGGR